MQKYNINHESYKSFFPDGQIVNYYSKYPCKFVEDFIFSGDPTQEYSLTPHQIEILDAIANNRRVSVRSGRGIGKTATIALSILWWLCTNDMPKIVCTAPTKPTLYSALWPEIHKWLRISLFKNIFEFTSTRLYLKEEKENWWAEPRTASKPEAMSGLHERNMFLIMDEASGIDDEIYDYVSGSLTDKNNKLVLISNPTRAEGFFYDSHNRHKKLWKTLRYDSEESPIVDHSFVEEMEMKFGRNHYLFQVHVKGEFPSGSPESFIPLHDVSQAMEREVSPEGEVSIGVDVARYGDDKTVVCTVQGNHVYPLEKKEKTSIPDTVALVLGAVKRIRKEKNYSDTIKVKVDDTGVGGGVTDLLKLDRENNIEVIPCNFGGAGDEWYENEASMMWGNLRDKIKFLQLPSDDVLKMQIAARKSNITARGRIRIQPKKDYKKDFKESPDDADAVVLALFKKANERVVLKKFDPLSQEFVISLKNKYDSVINGNRYCSIYYTKEMDVNILWCSYQHSNLIVTNEHIGIHDMWQIVDKIDKMKPYNRVLGNNIMFSKNRSDDLYTQYSRVGIIVSENYRYDEFGAIQLLERMVAEKRLQVSDECKNIAKQLHEWRLDINRSELDKKFGLCYALLGIISEVRNREKADVIEPLRRYSKERQELDNLSLSNIHKQRPFKRGSYKYLAC